MTLLGKDDEVKILNDSFTVTENKTKPTESKKVSPVISSLSLILLFGLFFKELKILKSKKQSVSSSQTTSWHDHMIQVSAVVVPWEYFIHIFKMCVWSHRGLKKAVWVKSKWIYVVIMVRCCPRYSHYTWSTWLVASRNLQTQPFQMDNSPRILEFFYSRHTHSLTPHLFMETRPAWFEVNLPHVITLLNFAVMTWFTIKNK